MKFTKTCSTVMMCLLLMSSCKTVKQARLAQKPENQRPGERTVTAAELGVTADRVLSLRELEDIAVRYAPGVIKAQQALASARIALK